jgi:hypothetical protein
MKSLILATLAAGALAQDAPSIKKEQRIFQLKHADARRLSGVLSIFPLCDNRWDDALRTISVCATSPEQMKVVEDTIRRFDVPSPSQNIDFTIFLLIASSEPAAGAEVSKAALPPLLDPVVKEISANLSHKFLRLAETLQVRTRDGSGAEVNSLSSQPGVDGQKVFYRASFQTVRIAEDEKGRILRVNNLRVGMRVPYRSKASTGPGAGPVEYQFTDAGLSTDIDVREGQKAVVGKANLDGKDALIVILVPRII